MKKFHKEAPFHVLREVFYLRGFKLHVNKITRDKRMENSASQTLSKFLRRHTACLAITNNDAANHKK